MDPNFDWHPASVTRRGNRCYISMTVPQAARSAMGGKIQIRLSANTSDPDIAAQRRHDLEGRLREQILKAVRREQLGRKASRYRTAIEELKLADTVHGATYDPRYGVVELDLNDLPTNANEAKSAIHILEEFGRRHTPAFPSDTETLLATAKHFGGLPPDQAYIQQRIAAAISDLEEAFELGPPAPKVSTYLTKYTHALQQRVERGDLKQKTARARTRHIAEFIADVGDLTLTDIKAHHAYTFAKRLADRGHGNSTVKTRVSDVTNLLADAVQNGELDLNPFRQLNLKSYGLARQNYSPLTDEMLDRLFTLAKLPSEVRDIWAILVATGMRLDEVALCRVHQVKTADGVLYFDLQNAEVKTRQSQRRVPVCTTLEPLVTGLCYGKDKKERLFSFPIKTDGKSRASERCLYWLSKAHLRKFSGDDKARYNNHSLRGTFKDKMRDADVPLEVHNAILGHDMHTVSAAYGNGPSLLKMKDAVDRPKHPYLHWINDID